ncbi:stress response transcriptional regulator NmlR [Streptococcus macacae]|uniref:HTH-type transcriptional regulator AdhR n=1 Tax=Streptococcus macacae NCTC 11558 TaxID=764298 RepID=G5JUL4_9STRE|nr:stress response transcriptional regulator NmlR [Streptococcus macacae]EHJ51675.1 putative HTH-type transcriptional regulator AdhR [Streptococcus macacae NCTC 11558]SUN78655.1 transcriptional regulator [Streptococcus macacae NCTC 11558]
MNIKKVSDLTGMSADTIRYYERIGLIPPIARTKSGIRNFTKHDVAILDFVRCFRKAGMSVEALTDYISLLEEGTGNEEARLQLLIEQRKEMDARLDELTQARERLNYKIKNYKNFLQNCEHRLFDSEEKQDEM